ncbi:OpgC domain-containing protein, partial [Bartonella sp. AP58NXGY]|uniref:OpgC domain-containing protein n=1 Tax=Bartonella sp. AP58NXGY TaxID=3243498 RepID=UPI0035D0D792
MKYQAVVDHNTQPFCRDTRIDVFRSLALFTIVINHIPGSVDGSFRRIDVGCC